MSKRIARLLERTLRVRGLGRGAEYGARCRRCDIPMIAASASDTPIGNTSRSNCSSWSRCMWGAPAAPPRAASAEAPAGSRASVDGNSRCMPRELYSHHGISMRVPALPRRRDGACTMVRGDSGPERLPAPSSAASAGGRLAT